MIASPSVVLVVEDQPVLRGALVEIVEGLGYRVESADNRRDAVSILKAHRVMLLLADVMLAGEPTGLALARLVRRACPSVGIVLMSGSPEWMLDHHSISVPVLAKPFRVAELRRVLTEQLTPGD